MASSSVRDSPTSQSDGFEPTSFEDAQNGMFEPQMHRPILQHQQMLLQQQTFQQQEQLFMQHQQQQQPFLQQQQRTFAQGNRRVKNFEGPTVEQLQPENNGRGPMVEQLQPENNGRGPMVEQLQPANNGSTIVGDNSAQGIS